MRLALCGNTFPGDTPAAVIAALRGPAGGPRPAAAGAGMAGTDRLWPLPVAPCGRRLPPRSGAHRSAARRHRRGGSRRLDRQRLPVWRLPRHSGQATRLQARLAPPPSGWPSPWTWPRCWPNWFRRSAPSASPPVRSATGRTRLAPAVPATSCCARRRASARSSARPGVRIVLAIEPEPDGGFERVGALCRWIRAHLDDSERIGVCWDLCHAAVVGGVARRSARRPGAHARAAGQGADLLRAARGRHLECHPPATPRVVPPRSVSAPGPRAPRRRPRPRLVRPALPARRRGTAGGRGPAHPLPCPGPPLRLRRRLVRHRLARGGSPPHGRAGVEAFELETYTLPVLPTELLDGAGIGGTMVAEMWACAEALGLLRGGGGRGGSAHGGGRLTRSCATPKFLALEAGLRRPGPFV